MNISFPHINLELISDVGVRSSVEDLLNLLESSIKTIKDLKFENQELKNEIANLKGEQGKPNIKPNNHDVDISSESHNPYPPKKRTVTNRRTRIKNKQIKIANVVICQLDKSELPSDAVNKGYQTTISQNIIFESNTTEYKREKYYSPSLNKTFTAPLPSEYTGYIDTNLKTFCHIFHHSWDITRSKLISGLASIGIFLSAGTLNNILFEPAEIIIQEKKDILKAGLCGNYAQIDGTSSKFFGMNYMTQIICSPDFAVFSTLPKKSRLHILYALQGEPKDGLQYSYNEETQMHLEHFKISKNDKSVLQNKFTLGQTFTELEFLTIIEKECPELSSKPNMFKRIRESFAFGFYFKQTEFSVIDFLVADDAPEYKMIAFNLMLCWVHDARYYNKLTPYIENHQVVLDDFKKQYWNFYRQLQEYKEFPSLAKVAELNEKFNELFIDDTRYFDLNKEIRRTQKNKKYLLEVLNNPLLPLHNNFAELMARLKVRKRDISLHTMSEIGTQIQDAMMSIIQTTKLQGIDTWKYISNLIQGKNQKSLAELIFEKQDNSS